MSASAALRRTSRASSSGQLTPSRPPPPPPAVAQAAAAAGGVVPQAQVSQHRAHPAGQAHMQGTGVPACRAQAAAHGACASHSAETLRTVQAAPQVLLQLGLLSCPRSRCRWSTASGCFAGCPVCQRSSTGHAFSKHLYLCHLQVRVTKNAGGDVSLISWDDPVLPVKEVYSAVLTADGKHALVKTPSGKGDCSVRHPAGRQAEPMKRDQQQRPMQRQCCHPRPVGMTACGSGA